MMICAPMTTQIKGYPFKVPIAGARPSAVLADKVKRVDWVARKVQYKGQLTAAELEQIQRVVAALIGRP